MTIKEVQNAIKTLKDDGKTEDEILYAFYRMYQKDEINFDQLEALVNELGYEITDEFRNMSEEDKKTKGYEDIPEEVVEETKTSDKDDKKEDDKKEDKKDDKEKDKEEEKEAMSLFGIDKD